jgi:diaminopimelate epimerase
MTSFSKYQGLGNDFIIIDNRASEILLVKETSKIGFLCNRNLGIGADGVVFCLLATVAGANYQMRMMNADGVEAQMCGNGLRCLAKYLSTELSIVDEVINIQTLAGLMKCRCLPDGNVSVDMGPPVLKALEVPTTLIPSSAAVGDKEDILTAVINSPLSISHPSTLLSSTQEVVLIATALSMGNPHCVIFVDDLDDFSKDFRTIGPQVSNHSSFPKQCNAEFIQVLTPKTLKMLVWERGSGPTLACGTGACAACVAGVLSGRCEREVTVQMPGGDLHIEWKSNEGERLIGKGVGGDKICGSVFMTGEALLVFSGTIDL